MTLTSSQAAKLLKTLNDNFSAITEKERKSREFNAALNEDVESARPKYDYAGTREELKELEGKIRKLKHAINVFNVSHTVPGFDMTIDEMLVYIPQLTAKKAKLAEMRSKLPKSRVEMSYGRSMSIIDYTYINYDLDTIEADYEKTSDELSRAQLALDAANSSVTFEIDI